VTQSGRLRSEKGIEMDSAKLNDWVQALGIFALVASLIFVGLQIRQDQEIAIVEAVSHRFNNAEALANLVHENSVVWTKGLDGEELSTEDFAIFSAITKVVEEHYRQVYVRFQRIGPFPPEDAARDYAYVLYHRPTLRRLFEAQAEFTDSRDKAFGEDRSGRIFLEIVDTILEDLDRRGVPKTVDNLYVVW
jgi:hypothetical protein